MVPNKTALASANTAPRRACPALGAGTGTTPRKPASNAGKACRASFSSSQIAANKVETGARRNDGDAPANGINPKPMMIRLCAIACVVLRPRRRAGGSCGALEAVGAGSARARRQRGDGAEEQRTLMNETLGDLLISREALEMVKQNRRTQHEQNAQRDTIGAASGGAARGDPAVKEMGRAAPAKWRGGHKNGGEGQKRMGGLAQPRAVAGRSRRISGFRAGIRVSLAPARRGFVGCASRARGCAGLCSVCIGKRETLIMYS